MESETALVCDAATGPSRKLSSPATKKPAYKAIHQRIVHASALDGIRHSQQLLREGTELLDLVSHSRPATT